MPSSDLIFQLTGLVTAVGVILNLAFNWWKAKRDFENNRGQNQALSDIKEQAGVETRAPESKRSTKSTMRMRILPRAPTPLPFFPIKVADAVPEPVEPEHSQRRDTDPDPKQGDP